jgi:preprotein translocase subunit SecA
MTSAVSRYNVLFESLRSRSRRPEVNKGLDGVVARMGTRTRQRAVSLRWLEREADKVVALRDEVRGHSEAALDEAVGDIRERFVRGRQDHAAVNRALALVREVARRETGEEPFKVQVMGALALYHGRIIEMLTGEGKTLTGSLAAPLIAWRYRHLHVLTVNDYLAARDARSREPIYRRCRLSVGAITHELDTADRFDVYARSIVYGTPKQITADWLRDQIRLGRVKTAWAGRQVLASTGAASYGPMIPGLRAALVDEADAVLIDEGVVPLIIARARREDEMSDAYIQASAVAAMLDEGPDYTVDHLRKKVELRRRGRSRCEEAFAKLSDPIFRARRRAEELVRQALVARHCYIRGHQYQIVDGQVVIVDEYTGRFLPDRSWEHGLHQAVEAKEGLEVTADRETLARMSFQRFFRSYPFLCGMTGTASDAIAEIERVYERPVSVIPTNRPMIRQDGGIRAFRTSEGRWDAVVDSILAIHAQGRPVLVGTRSIEASEALSERLEARGLEHRVLNANFDQDEATMIAQAGRAGAITVATNMAGRGTDIKLDEEARKAGGLHVLLTEMHGAKRIDRQFVGRSGRQGDPGSSRIFVSLEDELIEHNAPRLRRLARWRLGGKREDLGSPAWARLLFRTAQRSAEARARRNRAAVLRQDDWIDKNLPG